MQQTAAFDQSALFATHRAVLNTSTSSQMGLVQMLEQVCEEVTVSENFGLL